MQTYKIVRSIYLVLCGVIIALGQFSNKNYGILALGVILMFFGVNDLTRNKKHIR